MAFSAVISDLHRRLADAGYGDLRPVHGYIFQRIAGYGATSAQIAAHLGITRQSTQQILDELQQADYIRREPNLEDARSKLVALTAKGTACLEVVEGAFHAIDHDWSRRLGHEAYAELKQALATMAEAGEVRGPLRPIW